MVENGDFLERNPTMAKKGDKKQRRWQTKEDRLEKQLLGC
jgi:hypothetical protein